MFHNNFGKSYFLATIYTCGRMWSNINCCTLTFKHFVRYTNRPFVPLSNATLTITQNNITMQMKQWSCPLHDRDTNRCLLCIFYPSPALFAHTKLGDTAYQPSYHNTRIVISTEIYSPQRGFNIWGAPFVRQDIFKISMGERFNIVISHKQPT